MWRAWLFVFLLAACLVGIMLGMLAQLTGSATLKRTAEVLVLISAAAFLPLLVEHALEKPLMWAVVVLDAGMVVGGVIAFTRELSTRRTPT
ncbi:hypothetical protein SAMN04489712_104363 [Thermomonospora echinospora]|uniref:Uncharacterized protein n=1 Tax=Thermomonospora echinospora TaxID=1992 RepID=A0A1H5Z7G5_9ACTN|nr:hypothetical protein [Thermomonospora echinospora]SEG31547.1 hypothetical protein SAMN04489712_104363 [Thermomonospora echinospora]